MDDDQAVLDTLANALVTAGYPTHTARDGREALKIFDKHTIGIVITDIVMPEMEGIEMILELRRRSPDVLILAISGGTLKRDGDFLHYAKTLGANRVLAKPFRRKDLLEAVELLQSEG